MLSASVRQEAEVADPYEAVRKHVEEEAAEEFLDSESQEALLVVVGGIAPAETDVSVCQSDQPVIRDGDAVRVVAEVVENVFGATEGTLGVNDPSLPVALSDEIGEEGALRTWFHSTGKPQLASRKGVPQAGDKLAAEYFAQHFDRQEEVVA